jgi:hypothetical protein
MPKVHSDAGKELDATFAVTDEQGTLVVYYESRGGRPQRNADYGSGLELILQRLAAYPAVVRDAAVASTVVQQLPEPERRIEVDGYPYPVDLRLLTDIPQFRAAFGAAQARVGREPDAAGSGNPTKRVRMVLEFPESAIPAATELESWLRGRPAGSVEHWALVANPDYYRIADAVTSFETDLWTTKGTAIGVGDLAIIWQARGSGSLRGIIALAEVLEPPKLTVDHENPFWTDRSLGETVEERVKLRYIVPPRLPLWVGEAGNEFLDDLNVARARGGTVFHVTSEQWAQVMAAAGGWDARCWHTADRAGDGSHLRSRGQGRGLNAIERRVVEDYAMGRAMAYFSARKIPYRDVHSHESYDLHCDYPDRSVFVEVKGTTSQGESILLTFSEVELARRKHPDTILFVTSGIALDRSQNPPVASGGRDRVIEPWRPSPESLTPIAYECFLGEAQLDTPQDGGR